MSRIATPGQAQTFLRSHGYVVNTTVQLTVATASFQSAWRLGTAAKGVLLDVDGVVGPLTTDALREADERRLAGERTCSEHFSYREFACQCGGGNDGCPGNRVLGVLVDGAELLRTVGYRTGGLHPLSGLRCEARNTLVKGKKTGSLHQWGAALDVVPVLKTKDVQALEVFSGIGYDRSGKVKHVDVRGMSRGRGKRVDTLRPPNPTGSSPQRPAVFLDV